MLLILDANKLVEAKEGGEYVYKPLASYPNGGQIAEIRLRVWADKNGRMFVKALTDVHGLAVRKRLPAGHHWKIAGRELRLIFPWSPMFSNRPPRVESFCYAYEVLRPERAVELPMDPSQYPAILVEDTTFLLHWEVKVGKGKLALVFSDGW